MQTISKLFFFTTLVLLCSCKASKFITIDKDYKKLDLNLAAERIIIHDYRESISGGEDIYLPVLSHPDDLITFYPKLKKEHEEILRQTIIENLSSQANKIATITLELRAAKKEFSATPSIEKEYVAIEIVIKAQINNEIIEVTEFGEFYRKTMDAKYRKFERLYQNSLREVTYNALKKLKDKLSIN